MQENMKRQCPAVLFLVFNRIDTTKKVFEAIKSAQPSRLYIAADGAREAKIDEEIKVNEVRNYVLSCIDWDCEIKTLFREENLGCKAAVSGAIDWFFSYEEEGIVLEDDTVPNQSFFNFCEELLGKYRNDDRVMHISGTNFQDGISRGNGSYYFSNYTHVWGWATWKRAWKHYDVHMRDLPAYLKSGDLQKKNISKTAKRHLEKVFLKLYNNKIDTWDYQWLFALWRMKGISITPNKNLISNIGFGNDATHTKNDFTNVSNLKTLEFGKLTTPSSMSVDDEADEYVGKKFFMGLTNKLIKKLSLLIKRK